MRHLNAAMATVPPPVEKATDEIDYVRWLQQMQTDLVESVNGVMLRGARAVQIGDTAGGTMRPTSSGGRLVGWSLREITGTKAAVVRLYDGRSTDAPLVAVVTLPQGAAATEWMAPGGISLTEGLFIEFVDGGGTLSTDVEGAVFLGAAE